jgi:MFS family permease
MLKPTAASSQARSPGKFNYAWVILAACTVMIAFTYGLMYSYSVFFKPLAEHFNWDRSTVSLIYSATLIIRGLFGIGVGWLADRYGAKLIAAFCGFMIALGLILSSQVQTLWQLFITYGIIEAIGFSGAFGIGTSTISRWFTKGRGLALGISATGSGMGTLFIVPGAERLINALSWSQAYVICGIAAGIVLVSTAFLLRPALQSAPVKSLEGSFESRPKIYINLWQTIINPRMLVLNTAFFTFFFCIQLIMVHLVNYATDVGINPLIAATFISVIGAISIVGRLSSGAGSDKIGIHNTLILTRIFLIASFICLIFTRSLWAFYLFAVLFSLPYGGEIPQIPLYIGKYFGTGSMATLIGLNGCVTSIGGAFGAWVAGAIFDATNSYTGAFLTGAVIGLISLLLVLILKRRDQKTGKPLE